MTTRYGKFKLLPQFTLLLVISFFIGTDGYSRGDMASGRFYNTPNPGCSNVTVGDEGSCEDDLLKSIYHNRQAAGSLFSPWKMCFAKRLNEGVYISGQLTPRQIRYAADCGFQSIVSVFDHTAKRSADGKRSHISTATERHIAENIAGMKFFTVLKPGDEWNSLEAVKKMADIYSRLQLPALLHCERGVAVTFLILAHYVNQTIHSPGFKPRVGVERFYEITRIFGFDFLELFNKTLPSVKSITGQDLPDTARKPNVSLSNWFDYWQSCPIYLNWFIGGQLNARDVSAVKVSGFKTIINVRSGLTTGDIPSQEGVELINIFSGTPTYGTNHIPPRQSKRGLKLSVVDHRRSTSFVSESSRVNYESLNSDEFGDDIGYNEQLESEAVKSAEINYGHLPLVQLTAFEDFFREHKDTLLEIGKKGPVLVHCAIGLRAAMVAVLTAALQYNLSFDWALQRVKELGFGLSEETYPDVYKVYKDYLLSDVRVEL